MRVAVIAADQGGCGHYRAIWPAEALIRSGVDTIDLITQDDPRRLLPAIQKDGHVHFQPFKNWPAKKLPSPDVVGIPADADLPWDVIVLQRPCRKGLAQLIPFLQDRGIAVVVELDDDFLRIDPRNAAWWGYQAHLDPNNNSEWLQLAVQYADLVTVTTPSLRDVFARYARHEPVILPNYLPPHALVGARIHNAGAVIGWTGSVKTHPNDLRAVGDGVRRAVRLPECEGVHVVGTGAGVQSQLGLRTSEPFTVSTQITEDEDGNQTSSWLPISEYHGALDAIDVGIVPLQLNRFNEGKSWLKGLEFAGRGIPAVCTPTGPYRALAEAGGCLLAADRKAWYRQLSRLVQDRSYRADMSDQVRAVAAEHQIDLHADRWLEAWTQARAERLAAA